MHEQEPRMQSWEGEVYRPSQWDLPLPRGHGGMAILSPGRAAHPRMSGSATSSALVILWLKHLPVWALRVSVSSIRSAL